MLSLQFLQMEGEQLRPESSAPAEDELATDVEDQPSTEKEVDAPAATGGVEQEASAAAGGVEQEASAGDAKEASCTLHLSKLPAEANESEIRAIFTQYGPIADVILPSFGSPVYGKFCFLEFETAQSASAAKAAVGDEVLICGTAVTVTWATGKRKSQRRGKDKASDAPDRDRSSKRGGRGGRSGRDNRDRDRDRDRRRDRGYGRESDRSKEAWDYRGGDSARSGAAAAGGRDYRERLPDRPDWERERERDRPRYDSAPVTAAYDRERGAQSSKPYYTAAYAAGGAGGGAAPYAAAGGRSDRGYDAPDRAYDRDYRDAGRPYDRERDSYRDSYRESVRDSYRESVRDSYREWEDSSRDYRAAGGAGAGYPAAAGAGYSAGAAAGGGGGGIRYSDNRKHAF